MTVGQGAITPLQYPLSGLGHQAGPAMGFGFAARVLLCSDLFSRLIEARTDDAGNGLFRAIGVVSR